MKTLAVLLIAFGSLLSGCVVYDPHRGHDERYWDHDRGHYHYRGDRDRDGVRDRNDRYPDNPYRN